MAVAKAVARTRRALHQSDEIRSRQEHHENIAMEEAEEARARADAATAKAIAEASGITCSERMLGTPSPQL